MSTPKFDEGIYNESRRFKHVEALRNAYERARDCRKNKAHWAKIQDAYDRKPWKINDEIVPNQGQLTATINQAVTTYIDYVTERSLWARITIDTPDESGIAAEKARHIETAFQRWCVKRWKSRVVDMMLGIKDMLMFSKGVFIWEDESCPYPVNYSIASVWPNADAGMTPDKFDIVFLDRTISAVELWRLVAGENVKEGWDKASVLEMLRNSSEDYKKVASDFEARIRSGSIDLEADANSYAIVTALVTEYKPEGEPSISRYVFPQEAPEKPKQNEKSNEGFLYYKDNEIESMDHRVAIMAHTVCRHFYDDPSLAEQVYLSSQRYDIVMHRILSAIEDNMRVFLKSSSREMSQKLKKLRIGQHVVLPEGVDLIQERVVRPVTDAMNVTRMITNDERARTGSYGVGDTADNGGEKTATQVTADALKESKLSDANLKLLNAIMGSMMAEMYRRFVSQDSKSKHYGQLKKFKDFLEMRKLKPEDWKPDNVIVESASSVGSGSPSARFSAANAILGIRAKAPRDPGERLAQRIAISAVAGGDHVSDFMPDEGDLHIPEDSLIGLENDALFNPSANPANVQVIAAHLHMRHIPAHIQDAQVQLAAAQRLYEGIGQQIPEDVGLWLHKITDLLMGIDNVLAHTHAHIQLALSDPDKAKQAELGSYQKAIQQINGQQDVLATSLDKTQQARLEQSRQDKGITPEMQHQINMFTIKEKHEERMLAFKEKNAAVKAEQLQRHSEENSLLRNQLDVEKARTKTVIEAEAAKRKALKDSIANRNKNGSKTQSTA